MNIRHMHRKTKRTPKETARLRADRERYQREKPGLEQLLAEGGHAAPIPLGELLLLHQITYALKKERERQKMTLAELAESTKIDQAGLSRLENGRHDNPTIDTLYRIATALGKTICCSLQDGPKNPQPLSPV